MRAPLRLNKGLGTLATWNESAIAERALHLVQTAVEVWTLPVLPEAALAGYRDMPAKRSTRAAYSLDDHPNISPGQPMQPLFDALRKELLALDPSVSEDFFKLYITYKADGYFVHVIPQSKRLVLNLNMPFSELRDPERRARDVTNVGHWGRGDVEVTLNAHEDLPYILGLVRQALERQLHIADDEQ